MRAITFYPIGTRVQVGGIDGIITKVNLGGSEYSATYLVSWMDGLNHHEALLYDIEFKTQAPRVKMKFTIT